MSDKIQRCIAIGLVPILGSILYLLFTGWAYDDPYITYRYAENIYRGVGFVYNAGENVLSTTTPLFSILLALSRFFFDGVPQVALFISTISLPVGGFFLWDLARTYRKPIMGWSCLFFYPIFPLVVTTVSSETPLFIALVLGSIAFIARGKQSLGAILIALAVLTRLDALLPLGLIGAYLIISKAQKIRWKAIILFILIIIPWLLYAFYSFGSPIPVTLAAKQGQGKMGISEPFALGLFTILENGYLSRWVYWLMTILMFGGLIEIAKRREPYFLIPLWSISQFLIYGALGLPRYPWYYAPLVPGFMILVGLGIERLMERMTIRDSGISPRWMAGILASVAFVSIGSHIMQIRENPDPRIGVYADAGEWIEANTPNDAAVGTLEVGIIGFHADRKMIDFAGLIQPVVSEVFSPSTTYADSTIFGILQFQPEYLIINPAWFSELSTSLIDPLCDLQHTVVSVDFGFQDPLTIYRCDWTILAAIPPSSSPLFKSVLYNSQLSSENIE